MTTPDYGGARVVRPIFSITHKQLVANRAQSTLLKSLGKPKKGWSPAGLSNETLNKVASGFKYIPYSKKGIVVLDSEDQLLVHVSRIYSRHKALQSKLDNLRNSAKLKTAKPGNRAAEESCHSSVTFGHSVPQGGKVKRDRQVIQPRNANKLNAALLDDLIGTDEMIHHNDWRQGVIQNTWNKRWSYMQEARSTSMRYQKAIKTEAQAKLDRGDPEALAQSQIDSLPIDTFMWGHQTLMTFNLPGELGSGVMTKPHLDPENAFMFACEVAVFGSFDSRGCYCLIFWDLGLILEVPAGVLITFHSSLLYHSNIHLRNCKPENEIQAIFGNRYSPSMLKEPGVHETRYSLVFYTQGATVRSILGGQTSLSTLKAKRRQQLEIRKRRVHCTAKPSTRKIKGGSKKTKARKV